MFDLHCHSEFSMDSRESMESSIRVGINRNLKSICFTDHIDFFPEDWSKTYAFVPKDYFRSLNRVRYTYADKIEVLAGCELGMVRGIADEYDAYIREYPFDYVLLSLHTLENRDIAYEWAHTELPEVALKNYYDEMYRCLKEYRNYDALGHMDYIDRYFPDKSLIPPYSFYADEVDLILKHLIANGKALEVNTKGVRTGLFYFHPKVEILLRYRDLGGELITLGSDAHKKDEVGLGIRDAMKLLRELGFKNTYKFVSRKKYALPLG